MLVAFYKSTRPGLAGLYNRLVRWWEHGKYSHCELIFSDGISASSSYMDGGVRFEVIWFNPERWDFIEVPDYLEQAARGWFTAHEGRSYDLLGNIHFLLGFIPDARDKWFCSEAVAEALGMVEAWRYGPNSLAATLINFNKEQKL